MPTFSRSYFGVAKPGGSIVLNPAQLAKDGPLLQCEIRVDVDRAAALTAAGTPVPQATPGKILIDTGASATCVDLSILLALGITPIGQTQVLTPNGPAVQQIFPCGIAFPGAGLPSLERVFVLGSNLSGQSIIGLLGRDVLGTGLLVYDGVAGHWSIAF